MSEEWYPGQAYVHKHNANIRRAEEKAMSEKRAEHPLGEFILRTEALEAAAPASTPESHTLIQQAIIIQRIAAALRAALATPSPQPCFTCEGEQGLPATHAVFICAACHGEDEPAVPPRDIREPRCTCSHERSSHSEEMPYDCQDDCDCKGFTYAPLIVPAAIQEPAGSGAKLKPQPYNSEQEVGKSGVGPSVGSPRKVGEDGAQRIIEKCEQYWNEPNIGDAEIHAVLEFIHREARALRPSSAPVGEQKQEEGV